LPLVVPCPGCAMPWLWHNQDVIFIYMIFVSVWATMFLERWLVKQNTLAHLWGVMHIETDDILRREFVGEPRYNHWISENDSFVPASSLRLRALALPFIILSIALLVGYQVTMALYKSAFKDTDQLVPSSLPCFPPSLLLHFLLRFLLFRRLRLLQSAAAVASGHVSEKGRGGGRGASGGRRGGGGERFKRR